MSYLLSLSSSLLTRYQFHVPWKLHVEYGRVSLTAWVHE